VDYKDRHVDAIMDTFGPPKLTLVKGRGVEVWDEAGNRYLDGLGGIAVNALGHAHPALVGAVSDQVATLGHISNFFASPPQVELAEKLLEISQAPAGSRVFFTNSGTEANEAAFKMARRIPLAGLGARPESVQSTQTRTRILALENAFHGRSMGALAMTHKAKYREPFAPLPSGVEFVPVATAADPFEALRAAFGADKPPVAALVVEPIQGEAGVRALPPGYLSLARQLCTEHGALLVFDEVQSGMARTGEWFAHQHSALYRAAHNQAGGLPDAGDPDAGDIVQPDVMTLAKGLGGGFPIGAVVAFGPAAAGLLGPGMHGSTFGGNPLAAAAGLAVINTIEFESLRENAARVGDELAQAILAQENPQVAAVRGLGLLRAVQLVKPIADDVAAQALKRGLIVNPVTADAIRLAPPLILTKAQAYEMAALLDAAITDATQNNAAVDGA